MEFTTTNRKELISRIKERRQVLANASKELKKHFVGLDKIIDKVIKNIEIWYLMPELLTRPAVVNLFGLTGVGKTDLVRRLVKLLNFQNRFCEIQLTNKGSANHSYCSTISSVLGPHSGINSGEPGILLLDEIQNFRSIDEDGHELYDYKFQDIWSLLSDGKLSFEPNMEYLLSLLFSYKRGEIIEKQQKLMSQKGKKQEKIKPSIAPKFTRGASIISTKPISYNDDDDDDSDDLLIDSTGEGPLITDEPETSGRNSEYFSSYYSLINFKRVLRLTEPIEEIALWDNAKKSAVISSRLNDPNFYEHEDYSKLLIFISGNLDEAFYKFAGKTEEVDVDADLFHKESLKIDILDIKTALKERFKPEQIARFGNMHIIYPSLSKKSYKIIIAKRIKAITNDIKNRFKINVCIDESINDLIYKNGVFSLQGTRPVFSTISEIIENNIPAFLFKAFLNNYGKIKIFYSNGKICSDYGDKASDPARGVAFIGSLDAIKNERAKDLDTKILISVHEAGHAVTYGILTNLAPVQINANMAATESFGFTGGHPMHESEKMLEQKIIISLAGMCAEEIIFGTENKYSGCVADIEQATAIVSDLTRRNGMKGFNIKTSNSSNDMNRSYTNMEPTNKEMEKILVEKKKLTKDLLMKHIELLKEVAENLFKFGEILSKDFKKICAKHKISVNVEDSEKNIVSNYLSMYDDFKKNTKAEVKNTKERYENT